MFPRDAGARQRVFLRRQRLRAGGRRGHGAQRGHAVLGGVLRRLRRAHLRTALHDRIRLPAGAAQAGTDDGGLLQTPLHAYPAALHLLPAALHLPAARVGRDELGAVAPGPETAAVQFPVHGGAPVVHVPAHRPVPDHPGGLALAGEGVREGRAHLPGPVCAVHLYPLDSPLHHRRTVGGVLLERLACT